MTDSSKKYSDSRHNKMNFLEHLEVLRWVFMRIVIVLFVIACVVYVFREFVFHEIVMASKDMDFWTYTKFCNLSHFFNSLWPNFIEADVMCFDPINPDFLPGKVTGKFVTAMLVAFIGAIIVSFPYILWEFWRFLKPALYPKEKKSARGLVFFSSLLFMAGIRWVWGPLRACGCSGSHAYADIIIRMYFLCLQIAFCLLLLFGRHCMHKEFHQIF